MNSRRPLSTSPQSAFTMVEIAICLAIIGFALVAIIGVLPHGLDVQRENREETIINQDASVFMDAIRNAAVGLNDLTNYVFAITNYWTRYSVGVGLPTALQSDYDGYTYAHSRVSSLASVTPDAYRLVNGTNIIGVLGTPKYRYYGQIAGQSGYFVSNHVVAYVRAISGSAVEKPPQNNPTVQQLAFSYRLIPEVVPVQTYGASAYGSNLVANLHELRLVFRWPLLARGNAYGRQSFRTMVGGAQFNPVISGPKPSVTPLWFFQPQTYVKAPQ